MAPPESSHSISGYRCYTRHGWQQKWQQRRQPRGDEAQAASDLRHLGLIRLEGLGGVPGPLDGH
jgi:hypothetical protein